MEIIGKHGIYQIDIEKVTCTCPDFKFRRFKHAKMSEERRCCHLKEAMADIPFKVSKGWSKKKRTPIKEAERVVKVVTKILKSCSLIDKFEFCGSYRRKHETIGDLDIIIAVKDDNWSNNIEILKSIKEISEKVMISGIQKTSVFLGGIQVDLRFVKKDHFIFQLAHATGSKEHNIKLRAIAKRLGMQLSEYGLFRGKERIKKISSEEDIYKALFIPFVKPENR